MALMYMCREFNCSLGLMVLAMAPIALMKLKLLVWVRSGHYFDCFNLYKCEQAFLVGTLRQID